MEDHPPALTFMNALADVQATMDAVDGKEVETAKATVQQSRGRGQTRNRLRTVAHRCAVPVVERGAVCDNT